MAQRMTVEEIAKAFFEKTNFPQNEVEKPPQKKTEGAERRWRVDKNPNIDRTYTLPRVVAVNAGKEVWPIRIYVATYCDGPKHIHTPEQIPWATEEQRKDATIGARLVCDACGRSPHPFDCTASAYAFSADHGPVLLCADDERRRAENTVHDFGGAYAFDGVRWPMENLCWECFNSNQHLPTMNEYYYINRKAMAHSTCIKQVFGAVHGGNVRHFTMHQSQVTPVTNRKE